MSVPKLVKTSFPNPYQYKTVSANSRDVIYDMPVTGGYVAFAKEVYIAWFSNTWLELVVDGVRVGGKIEHEIGSLSDPQTYEPPLVARKRIKVVAHNEDSSAHTFEAKIDGILARLIGD